VQYSITLEALELWLDLAPAVISIQNKHGNVALSQVGEESAVDQSLMIANRTPPMNLLLLDADGDTPLHCVLQNRALEQVLHTTIEKCPFAVFSVANKTGRLPLHEAVDKGDTVDIVKLLLHRSSPDELGTTDTKGILPIHLLSSASSIFVAHLLIEYSPPSSLLREDDEGMLPLHSALSARAEVMVIIALVDKSPSPVLQ
jgi:ankyrin repeat protein